MRTIRRWSGKLTKDGRLGLYAPPRGGLDMVRPMRVIFLFNAASLDESIRFATVD